MRTVSFLLMSLMIAAGFFTGCKSVSRPVSDNQTSQLDAIVLTWSESLRTRDLDGYCGCYWPDAVRTIVMGDGEKGRDEGLPVIREMQGHHFESDYPYEEIRYKEPERLFETETGLPQYIIEQSDDAIVNVLQFEERKGEWKIIDQWVFIREIFGLEVPTPFQEWADEDGDGLLNFGEQQRLTEANLNVMTSVGAAGNPVDDFFDGNGDGFIEEIEKEYALRTLGQYQLKRMQVFDKQFAFDYVSNNKTTKLDRHDVWFFPDFLILGDEEALRPRAVSDFYDHKMDFNEDGFINRAEIDEYINLVLRKISLLPAPPFPLNGLDKSTSEVYEWVDIDQNGELDRRELNDLAYVLLSFFINDWEIVLHPAGAYFDADGNFELDEGELERARDFFLEGCAPFIFQTDPGFASLYLDHNGNGKFDREESDAIESFFPYRIEQDEEYAVSRPMDELLDRNGDGIIVWDESGQLEEVFLSYCGEIWVSGTSRPAGFTGAGTIDSPMAAVFGNGAIGPEEMRVAVIGVTSPLPEIDDTVKDGLLFFVENALVKIRGIEVVERRDIDSLKSEYLFQQSGMIDEETAVEIGKLSGANIAALGRLTYMSDRYFLNLRLIDVTNGKIVGSSISEAPDESEFPQMCLDAAAGLFTN